MGCTSSKPPALVWLAHRAAVWWCPGWPKGPTPGLPFPGRMPKHAQNITFGVAWDQLRFFLTFSSTKALLLETMVFFFIGIHKEMEALEVELLAQDLSVFSVQLNSCHCTLGKLWGEGGQSRSYKVETLIWPQSIESTFLLEGQMVNEISTQPTAAVSWEWVMGELLYWACNTGETLLANSKEQILPIPNWLGGTGKGTARPSHNWLAEHHGIRQLVMIIIKHIHTTAFEKNNFIQLFLCTHIFNKNIKIQLNKCLSGEKGSAVPCPFANDFKKLNLALGLMESHRIGYAVGIDCEKKREVGWRFMQYFVLAVGNLL